MRTKILFPMTLCLLCMGCMSVPETWHRALARKMECKLSYTKFISDNNWNEKRRNGYLLVPYAAGFLAGPHDPFTIKFFDGPWIFEKGRRIVAIRVEDGKAAQPYGINHDGTRNDDFLNGFSPQRRLDIIHQCFGDKAFSSARKLMRSKKNTGKKIEQSAISFADHEVKDDLWIIPFWWGDQNNPGDKGQWEYLALPPYLNRSTMDRAYSVGYAMIKTPIVATVEVCIFDPLLVVFWFITPR